MTSEATSTPVASNDGKLMGILSIVAAPGALLVSPTMFPLLSFFFALMGLTVASPGNRYLSFIGMTAAAICGIAGYYFNTSVI